MQRRINDECQQTRKKRVTFRETVEIYGTTTEIVHMSNTSSHGRRQRLERSSSSIRELQQLQEIALAIENLAAPNSRQRHDSSAGESEHGEILMAISQLQQQISEIDAKFAYLCRELKREVENVQLGHNGTTIQFEHILGRIAQLERMQAFRSPTPSFEFVRNGNNASTPLEGVQNNGTPLNGTYNPSPITNDDQRVQQPNDGLFSIHLKNCWDKYACHIGIQIIGTECLKLQKTDQSVDWSYVFSTCPVPTGSAGIFYFEVDIFHVLSCFTIGLATKQMELAELAVPEHNSFSAASEGIDHFLLMICMSSSNQQKQQNGSSSSSSATKSTTTTTEFFCGDIVGFGIELANGRIIVTKNGRRLDIADLFFSAAQPLFPFVSLRDFGATIEANFGPNFKFNP